MAEKCWISWLYKHILTTSEPRGWKRKKAPESKPKPKKAPKGTTGSQAQTGSLWDTDDSNDSYVPMHSGQKNV